MSAVGTVLSKWALRMALREPAPTIIPRSGPRTAGLNCFVAQLGGRDNEWPFMATELGEKAVLGKWWSGTAYELPCSIPYRHLRVSEVQITHYIGPYEFRAASAVAFLAQELLGWPYVSIFKDKLDQFFYNRRKLVRKERIEVLRIVLEGTIKNRRFAISAVGLMSTLYSNRWVFHPEKDEYLNFCTFLLDSLVGSGDLARDPGSIAYKLAPQALTTLTEYEEDERKHRDNVLQQSALKWLTVALVLVGIAQVYVSWK